MKAYYTLKIDCFNTEMNQLTSDYQLGINNIFDNKPHAYIEKLEIQAISNFIKYDLYCEYKNYSKGRAYGKPEPFDSFIQIFENKFYYNNNDKIAYLCCPRDVYKTFCKIFEKNDYIKYTTIIVDFQKIITNHRCINIQAIWLGDVKTDISVNAINLTGNKLENSSKYQDLLDEGCNITNLTIIYKYFNDEIRVMITKDGGIVFYENIEETEALGISNDIYHNLFL